MAASGRPPVPPIKKPKPAGGLGNVKPPPMPAGGGKPKPPKGRAGY